MINFKEEVKIQKGRINIGGVVHEVDLVVINTPNDKGGNDVMIKVPSINISAKKE